MAFRNVALPWLSGGLLVVGYAAFSWLRARHQSAWPKRSALPSHDVTEPFANHLQRVPDELALADESEPLPANALSRSAELGARFLGRASDALSAFPFGPHWPERPR